MEKRSWAALPSASGPSTGEWVMLRGCCVSPSRPRACATSPCCSSAQSRPTASAGSPQSQAFSRLVTGSPMCSLSLTTSVPSTLAFSLVAASCTHFRGASVKIRAAKLHRPPPSRASLQVQGTWGVQLTAWTPDRLPLSAQVAFYCTYAATTAGFQA